MPDYQKGKIYTIRFHNINSIYIGSTTQYISSRFHQHKQPHYKTSICKYIENNPDVDNQLIGLYVIMNFMRIFPVIQERNSTNEKEK